MGQHRLALESDGATLWRKAVAGQATVAECDALTERADRYGMILTYRTGLTARLLCLHAADSRVVVTREERAALIETARGVWGWREFLADLVHALRRGDHATVAQIRDRWIASNRPWSPNYQLVDRICVFAGHPPVFAPPSFGEGSEDAEIERRWNTIIAALVHPDAGEPS